MNLAYSRGPMTYTIILSLCKRGRGHRQRTWRRQSVKWFQIIRTPWQQQLLQLIVSCLGTCSTLLSPQLKSRSLPPYSNQQTKGDTREVQMELRPVSVSLWSAGGRQSTGVCVRPAGPAQHRAHWLTDWFAGPAAAAGDGGGCSYLVTCLTNTKLHR